MAHRTVVKTTFEASRTIQPFYTGGSVALTEDGRIFAGQVGEDVVLTDLSNDSELAKIEGVSLSIAALVSSLTLTRGCRTESPSQAFPFHRPDRISLFALDHCPYAYMNFSTLLHNQLAQLLLVLYVHIPHL